MKKRKNEQLIDNIVPIIIVTILAILGGVILYFGTKSYGFLNFLIGGMPVSIFACFFLGIWFYSILHLIKVYIIKTKNIVLCLEQEKSPEYIFKDRRGTSYKYYNTTKNFICGNYYTATISYSDKKIISLKNNTTTSFKIKEKKLDWYFSKCILPGIGKCDFFYLIIIYVIALPSIIALIIFPWKSKIFAIVTNPVPFYLIGYDYYIKLKTK